jgi:hypothetical protein
MQQEQQQQQQKKQATMLGMWRFSQQQRSAGRLFSTSTCERFGSNGCHLLLKC